MIKTRVCDIFDIKYPIFQGGMAWVSDANLAAAVSKAGGLGFIAAMNAGPDYVREQIDLCREMLNGEPFGVNIMLMSPYAEEVAQVVIEKNVPVVATGAGSPAKYMAAWLEVGIKVVPVIPSTALAKRMERMGATAVVAEGGESGGHVGDLTTMTLVPQVVDAVEIPVIAAGGIADGRGIVAAFMLGAEGVQCGTRFLAVEECNIHQNVKDRVVAAKDIDTMVTGRRSGHPVRAFKNNFTKEYAKMEWNESLSEEEINSFGVGALRKAFVEGDTKTGSVMAGQIAGMVKDIVPAKVAIERMFEEAEEIMNGAAKWVK